MQDLKLYCIFAEDQLDKMKDSRGKLAAMAGHAYLHSWWNAFKRPKTFLSAVRYWMQPGATKVCLVAPNVDSLLLLYSYYKKNYGSTIVQCSSTTFEGEVVTPCIGIGPISQNDPGMELVLRSLELLN